MLEEQTKANRPNQNNPWGNIEWSRDADGNWTQDTTLNDNLQGALDSQLDLQQGRSDLAGGMLGRMEGEYGQPIDWSKYGDQTGLEFNPDEIRQKAEDAAYGRATDRLDPRFEQSDESLEVSLRNRGLSEGDAAFDSAMQNQSQSKTDAYSAAQQDAVGQGRSEANQMYQQQMGQADYANKLRQSAMNEEMQRRGFSLNEINSIMSGQQVQAPNFQDYISAGRVSGADYTGAANAQSNFDQAQAQNSMGGLGSLFKTGMSAASMFSDRRLKKNIQLLDIYMGIRLYTYEYIWGVRGVGVMSDEINPEAVTRLDSGFDFVDYSKIKARI